MAGAAYRYGFCFENWWPGAGLSIIAKGPRNSDLVKQLTQVYFDGVVTKQFRAVRIPQCK